jgi:DNA-binding NarL/FixJ family response regulator
LRRLEVRNNRAMTERDLQHRRAVPTVREIQIIRLLAQGKSSKQIARELGISVRTVEAHRSRVMQKLHVRSLADLLHYAMDRGMVAPRDQQGVINSVSAAVELPQNDA